MSHSNQNYHTIVLICQGQSKSLKQRHKMLHQIHNSFSPRRHQNLKYCQAPKHLGQAV